MVKRGQMKLSFGMIFSIILIIVFIAFAFYAIQKVLEIQDAIKVGQFVDGLQSDIDKMWRGDQGASPIGKNTLPKKIKYVCFTDITRPSGSGPNEDLYEELKSVCYNEENMVFYPIGSAEGLDVLEIKHIDIEEITKNENPFCIENDKGKVKMIVKKGFGEELVVIARS